MTRMERKLSPPATDPTHDNLAAALLDQKIAGLFRGKDYAFAPVMLANGKWGVGIAVANDDGYTPVEGGLFEWADADEARQFCRGMNLHINLPADHEAAIICSTMGGWSYRR